MPEIMSAGVLFTNIEQAMSESHGYSAHEIISTIKARDFAMLEKYKEAVEELKANLPRGFMSHDDEVYYDALSDCIQVLDSAFADIEGGK